MEMREIKFTLNGKPCEVAVKPWRTLLEMLREDLQLTGVKEGCGEGECGSCTVIMNGKSVNSCLVPAMEADNQEIVTSEGLADGDNLHPIQRAFRDKAGMQCGFCTSGMILSTVALLHEKPKPTDAEVLAWLNPHLCRCCGYPRILQAVHRAVAEAKR